MALRGWPCALPAWQNNGRSCSRHLTPMEEWMDTAISNSSPLTYSSGFTLMVTEVSVRRVASYWRIINVPVFAELSQWTLRTSSPGSYSRNP